MAPFLFFLYFNSFTDVSTAKRIIYYYSDSKRVKYLIKRVATIFYFFFFLQNYQVYHITTISFEYLLCKIIVLYFTRHQNLIKKENKLEDDLTYVCIIYKKILSKEEHLFLFRYKFLKERMEINVLLFQGQRKHLVYLVRKNSLIQIFIQRIRNCRKSQVARFLKLNTGHAIPNLFFVLLKYEAFE